MGKRQSQKAWVNSIGKFERGVLNAEGEELRLAGVVIQYLPISSSVRRLICAKCDERRPECQNCNRNRLHCSLIFLTPGSYTALGKTSTVVIPPRKSSQTAYLPPPNTSFNSLSFSMPHARSRELLYHYTSIVCKTITSNHVIEILGTEIHRMRFTHPFLMSGTLAVSALHLSRLVPARCEELSAIAIKAKHAALPSYQSALAEINPSNIHAVFAFSSTVIPYIMASTPTNKCVFSYQASLCYSVKQKKLLLTQY